MSAVMPYVKWHGRDWLGDPMLRMVGPEVRGVWIDLLCAMMNAEPYGHLAVNGKPMTDEQAARMCGVDKGTFKGILDQIEQANISSRTECGMLYSRRLVRDHEAFRTASMAGKKGGGNPNIRTQNTETRSQKPEARRPLKVPFKEPFKEPFKGEGASEVEKPKTFKQWTREDLAASVAEANHDRMLTDADAAEFVDYWMEPTPTGRSRMSLERTWDTRRRMKTANDMIYSKRGAGSFGKSPRRSHADAVEASLNWHAEPGGDQSLIDQFNGRNKEHKP